MLIRNIRILNSFSEKNHNLIQMGTEYLEFDIRNRKADNSISIVAGYNTNEVIKLVENAFAFTIHDAFLSTSAGVENDQNEDVGPISTIMRLVTQKDCDLAAYFDVIVESENGINNSLLKQTLINNHTAANRGVIRGHLPLEYFFGFSKSIIKTKSLGFELELRKTKGKKVILYTTLRDNDVFVTINNFNFNILSIIPNPETQLFLTKISNKLSHYPMNFRRLIETQSKQLENLK